MVICGWPHFRTHTQKLDRDTRGEKCHAGEWREPVPTAVIGYNVPFREGTVTAWAAVQSCQGTNSGSEAAFSPQNQAAPAGFMVVNAAVYSILRSRNQ